MKFKSAAFVVLAAILAGAYWLYSKAVDNTIPPCNFTFAKDTTVITKPKDDLGYPDYESALNEALRKNIKPEENANVLFWQAFGPTPEGGKPLHKDYFSALGAECPKANEANFIHIYNLMLRRNADFDEKAYNKRDLTMNSSVWKAVDYPEHVEWLKSQEQSLAILTKSAQLKQYYNPLVARNSKAERVFLFAAKLPAVQKVRAAADTFCKRAMLRLGEGKTDEAWADILTTFRLGRLVSQGGTLIELLVGHAIDAIANQKTQIFLEHAILSSHQIAKCKSDLERLLPLASLEEKIDLNERFSNLDMACAVKKYGPMALEQLANDDPVLKRNIADALFRVVLDKMNWDAALRVINRYFDRAVNISKIPKYEERKKAWEDFEVDLREKKLEVGNFANLKPDAESQEVGERFGLIMVTHLFPGVQKIQAAQDCRLQYHRNLEIAFALAAFRADNKKYPALLDELTPKYIKAVPLDYFTDKPLIYKPDEKGYLLYSVGVNGEDDDGVTFGEDPPGDDVIVRVPHRIP